MNYLQILFELFANTENQNSNTFSFANINYHCDTLSYKIHYFCLYSLSILEVLPI